MLEFLLLALWLERVLAFLAIGGRTRIAIALLLAYASGLVPTVLWICILGCAFLTLVWIAAHRPKWTPVRIIGAVIASVLLVFVAFAFMQARRVVSASRSYDNMSEQVSSAPQLPKGAEVKLADRQRDELSYQGLPAKFELPGGVRYSSFHEQLLASERPQTITIVLLSMTVLTWASIVMTAIAAWLLWTQRALIRTTLRERIAAATTPAAPATA